MITWWMVVGVGAAGGFLNHLLLEGGDLVMPSYAKHGRRYRLHLGFLGNIAVGIGAAFLAYVVVAAGPNLNVFQYLAATFGGALGGANFLTSYIQKGESSLTDFKANAYKSAADELAEP